MSKGMSDGKALGEFLSEAQEIVESLGNNLMLIDRGVRADDLDPDLVNEVFRGMHSLKGLAGTFGVESLSRLAHNDENLLDEIRLGRVELNAGVLDRLFSSVDAINYILGVVSEFGVSKADRATDINQLITGLAAANVPAEEAEQVPAADPALALGAEILEVLTEYEEHRLRTNLQRGLPIFRIGTQVPLETIDKALENLKTELKPIGEIITYLPSTESEDPDQLGLDIILALKTTVVELESKLEGLTYELTMMTPDGSEDEDDLGGVPDERSTAMPSMAPGGDRMTLAPPSPDDPNGTVVKAEQGSQNVSLKSVSQSVRVDIRKLDRLMNVVGEMTIVRGALSRLSEEIGGMVGKRGVAIELHRIERGFARRLAELREGILEVRMVPVGQMFDRLARVVRKISRELGKEVHFIVSGADTEIDKLIVEELSDPLMHIIRNCIDHGVEIPAKREADGKPSTGTVALTAYQKGNHVLLEVEDDGAGIDFDKVRAAAVARGLLSAEQAEGLSYHETSNLIFLPGISTAEQTTEISGRGVGMDVVKTNIASLGGVVEVESELQIGTKFTITLPVTLAIISALLVVLDERTYAVPLNTVGEALFISPSDVRMVMGAEAMTLHGRTLPLCRLDSFFGRPRSGPIPEGACVVVAALGQRRLGLVVDGLIGQQEVVIKSLGQSLASARWFSGATDLGDQRLALVLDTGAVIEQFFTAGEGASRLAGISG